MESKNKVGIEAIISIFKAEKGNLQLLIIKKEDKWMLPNRNMLVSQTIEDCVKEELEDLLDYSDIYLKQASVLSSISRKEKDRVVGVAFIGITDSITEKMKFHIDKTIEYSWVSIDNVPTLAYDHNEIIENLIEKLRKDIQNPKLLVSLFPNEFTLPELQRVIEQLLAISLDRRNFRKHLLVKEWVRETGKMSEGSNGRPGKLYKFEREIKDGSFF